MESKIELSIAEMRLHLFTRAHWLNNRFRTEDAECILNEWIVDDMNPDASEGEYTFLFDHFGLEINHAKESRSSTSSKYDQLDF